MRPIASWFFRRASAAALVVAASSASASGAGVHEGTLCVAGRERKIVLSAAQCRPADDHLTIRDEVSGRAAGDEGTILWVARDFSRVVAATTAGAADTARRTVVGLSVATKTLAPLREDVEITVGADEGRSWRWSIPYTDVSRFTSLELLPGQYTITVRAKGYLTVSLDRLRIRAHDAAISIGTFRMIALPKASGKVVDRKGRSVANAEVALPTGAKCAISDQEGLFQCQLGEPLPSSLQIRHAGSATREIPLPAMTADVDLGRIELSAPSGIRVQIKRGAGAARPIKVEALRRVQDQWTYKVVASTTAPAAKDEVILGNLQAGSYMLRLSSSPLERIALPVDVPEGGRIDEIVTIEPFDLRGSLKYGVAELHIGTVELTAPEHAWSATLPIASDGSFGGTMWQTGTFTAVITAPELPAGEFVTSPELRPTARDWEIRLTRRVIQGRILESRSQEPVRGAALACDEMLSDGTFKRVSAPIAADGSFELTAGKNGEYRCVASAPEFGVTRQVVRVEDSSASVIRLDFSLTRGGEHDLVVTWPDGSPVGNARVAAGLRDAFGNAESLLFTDAMGTVQLRSAGSVSRTIVVLPQEGSFAIQRIALTDDVQEGGPTRVEVPTPSGLIRVSVHDAGGAAVANAIVVVRYNGGIVPPAIVQLLAGGSTRTSALGDLVLRRIPAGRYEFWATRTMHEAMTLIESGPGARPSGTYDFRDGTLAADATVLEAN